MEIEVTNVSEHGFWILMQDRERCLDVDLSVDSIDHPDRYPLVSKKPAVA